jgi:hypothetical protein
MKRQQWGLYAVALAILVVGLVWAGVPASTVLIAGLILVCPLTMLFMMRGMHGGDSARHDEHTTVGHDHHERLHDAGHRQPTEGDGHDDVLGIWLRLRLCRDGRFDGGVLGVSWWLRSC